MAQHHALRATSGATGIYKVREVVAGNVCCDSVTAYCTDECLNIDGLVGRNRVETVSGGDDVAGLTVFEDKSDTVSGVFRVAGDIGCSGFQHTEE